MSLHHERTPRHRSGPSLGLCDDPRLAAGTGDEPSLRMSIDLRGGRMSLTGRLDRHCTHTLTEGVPLLLGTDHPTWVLDAAGLEVGDVVGLQTLGAAYRRLLRHGRELRVVNESPGLRAVLTRLRLDVHLLAAPS